VGSVIILKPNYLFTYFGLSISLRDTLQDPVSSTRMAPARPIVDLSQLVPLLTALGTHITACATLARNQCSVISGQ
jgi:hypothetical protein